MDAKERRIAEQDQEIAELKVLLKAALEKIAHLEAEIAVLKKHSGNSSKPPSSDIVKPPKDKDRRRKKKIGAQTGHKQHLRTPFAPNQIDRNRSRTLMVADCEESRADHY
jgi:transposase